MRSVHPAFDTKTKMWFTVEPGLKAEAASLKELSAKLGGDVRIEGYIPLPVPRSVPSGTTADPVLAVKCPAPPAAATRGAVPAESPVQAAPKRHPIPWGSLTADEKVQRRRGWAQYARQQRREQAKALRAS